jgi:glycosyltransferase involved in cell wall biosynthesis
MSEYKKVVHFSDMLRPGGGPLGYLYNLKIALDESPNDFVLVYSQKLSENRTPHKSKDRPFPDFINRYIKLVGQLRLLLGLRKIHGEDKLSSINDAIIVSHSVTVAARLRRIYNDKICLCLMPHGPRSYSEEVAEEIKSVYGDDFVSKLLVKILIKLEKKVILDSSAIICATKHGLKDYFNGRGVQHNHIFEVTSGLKCEWKAIDQDEARRRLSIEANKFVVGYFGRYNTDKGYDYFISEISNINSNNILFISAGVGPLERSSFENYINYGWRSDVELLISACDFVVLPNKYTYFDLLPLESMSIGVPVIASNIGGNIHLAALCPSVKLFERNKGVLSKLINDLSSNYFLNKKNDDLKNTIRMEFEMNFSPNVFVKNHRNLAIELIKHFSSTTPCDNG